MARNLVQIDLNKLRREIRKLPNESVYYMLDDAIDLLPPANLHKIAKKYLDLKRVCLDVANETKTSLLTEVKLFEKASLAGEYYQSFDVNAIQERNRQILQMRREGIRRGEVARAFQLSPTRIYLLERRAATDQAMAERRAKLRAEIRTADDPDRMWPVTDLADAIEPLLVAKKRLLEHFQKAEKSQIGLREFTDLCLDAPDGTGNFMMPPLLKVCGIGKKGFWSIVDGLTGMDMGSRCNHEWRHKLAIIKQSWKLTG